MKKMVTAVAATLGVALAISACGGYDPSSAVDTLNKELNTALQTSLEAAGVPSAEASKTGITVKCPDSVEKGQAFDCTITGKASGESVTVPMEINDSDELEPAEEAQLNEAVQKISEAETTKSLGQ